MLKNAIDWGSRPHGQNSWGGKAAAIMGASNGPIGTFGAQQHLRNICSCLNIHVMNQPEFYFNGSIGINENGISPESVDFVTNFLTRFSNWIAVFNRNR